MEDSDPKTTAFLRKSQSVVEILFLLFIALGMFYPHVPYGKLQVLMDKAYFVVVFFGSVVYVSLKKLTRIRFASQDSINLLRTGLLLYFFMMVLPFVFLPVSQYLNGGGLPKSADPPPQTFLETVGFLFAVPALLSTLLFPYLRIINLMENPQKKAVITACCVGATLIVHALFQNQILLVGGFLASYIPLISKNHNRAMTFLHHSRKLK